MSNTDPIRAALYRLIDAVDGRRWNAFEHQDAIAAARAALATRPATDEPAVPEGREPAAVDPDARALIELPPNCIDPEHSGEDRRLLEVFYRACNAEGGTADEIHLRGIRAVLALAPAPAVDRLPGVGDCDTEGRCWLFAADTNQGWVLHYAEHYTGWTHWLPHWAIPQSPQGGEVEP